MGLTLDELFLLEYGFVVDLMTETGNDDCEWTQLATQEDFDRFTRS